MGTIETESQSEQKARQVGDQARQEASRMAGQAREKGEQMAESRKQSLAEQLGGVAQALRNAVGQLNRQDQSGAAQIGDQIAGGIENLSQTLKSNDVRSLLDKTQDFARRQPAVFLGGAVAAGFILSRFIKSGASEVSEEHGGEVRVSEGPQPPETSIRESTPGASGTFVREEESSTHEATSGLEEGYQPYGAPGYSSPTGAPTRPRGSKPER